MNFIMKHLLNTIMALILPLVTLFISCSSEDMVYDGPSYVMFADTANVCPVFEDNTPFQVRLSVTKAASYDRTFGVEVLHAKSNAVEGFHYRMESNTVRIPAGELAASVKITPVYENIEDTDSLNIRLRLVLLDADMEWEHYGLEANVSFRKIAPFNIKNFTGYAVVTSTFLFQYQPQAYRRLIRTEMIPGEENKVLMHDFLSDGFDVRLTLDNSDPLNPKAHVQEGDIIGTSDYFLGVMVGGDNMLRVVDYAAVESYFSTNKSQAALYSLIYVKDKGYLGAYVSVVQWISDAEAEDILKNGF